eukprot:2735612-Rhodomonas_salina.1
MRRSREKTVALARVLAQRKLVVDRFSTLGTCRHFLQAVKQRRRGKGHLKANRQLEQKKRAFGTVKAYADPRTRTRNALRIWRERSRVHSILRAVLLLKEVQRSWKQLGAAFCAWNLDIRVGQKRARECLLTRVLWSWNRRVSVGTAQRTIAIAEECWKKAGQQATRKLEPTYQNFVTVSRLAVRWTGHAVQVLLLAWKLHTTRRAQVASVIDMRQSAARRHRLQSHMRRWSLAATGAAKIARNATGKACKHSEANIVCAFE